VLPFLAGLGPCFIGIDLCHFHHWARELIKLGHEMQLMPLHYVKPQSSAIRRRGRGDLRSGCPADDALRAGQDRPALVLMHRTRQIFIRQRTTLINSIRARHAEFSIIAVIGRNGVHRQTG
jgi:transposase